MYKDVWKKFGWKMLIAVCSVLLLGGVAFAAPRLQAEEDEMVEGDDAASYGINLMDVSTGTSIDAVQKVKLSELSGESEKYFDLKDNLVYKKDTKQTVTSLYYKNDEAGVKEWTLLKLNTDFFYDWEKEGINANEEERLVIQPTLDSRYFSADGGWCYLKAPIKRAPISDVYGEGAYVDCKIVGAESQGYLTMTDTEFLLDKTQVVVTIYNKEGQEQETLPIEDYELENNSFKDVKAGPQKYDVILKNYTYNGSERISNAQCILKKNIINLEHNVEPSEENPRKPIVTVTDSAIALRGTWNRSDRGYDYWIAVEALDEGGSEFRITLTATDDSYYIGEWSTTYSSKGSKSIENPRVEDENFSKIIDYDINGGNYKQDFNTIVVNGEILTKGSQFIIGEYGFYDGKNTVIDGATAGRVKVAIIGIGEYRGSSASIEYYVRRNLENADIIFEPEDPQYTFNRKANQKPNVKIVFDDSEECILKSSDDYELSWMNDRNAAGYDREDQENNWKDAGTITVTATGTGSNAGNGYGYYGSKTASYSIAPLQISEREGYRLELRKQAGELIPRFEYTGEVPEVEAGATIVYTSDNGNSINMNELVEGEDYTIVPSANGEEVGEHTVTFYFKGNYTGSISAKYEVYAYDLSKSVVVLGDCQCGGVKSNTHPYNGKEHRPMVTVYQEDGNTLISSDTYTVSYDDNLEVGMATVTVVGKAVGSGSKQVTFTIIQGMISDNDGKALQATFASTEYFGPNTVPTILEMRYDDIVLNPNDYEVVDVVPVKEGDAKWGSALFPTFEEGAEESNEYYVKIKMKVTSSITGDATTENTVKFTPRNIEPIGRVVVTGPEDSAAVFEDVALADYIRGHMTVYDADVKKNLNETVDYTFTSVDNKGIVTVTIQGKSHYKGSKKVTFNMGENIAGSTVYEDGKSCGNGLRGAVMLKGTYAYIAGKEKLLTFISSGGTGIALRAAKAPNAYLKEGEDGDYTVDYQGSVMEGEDLYGIVNVTGTGNGYYGTLEIRYKIGRKALELKMADWADGKEPDYVYDGTYKEPKINMKDGEYDLRENTDYKVSYDHNLHNGYAEVVITGMGNYQGEISKQFTIKRKELKLVGDMATTTGGSIELAGLRDTYEYSSDSDGVRPEFSVRDIAIPDRGAGTSYTTLIDETDYNVTYKNNTMVTNEAQITITALSTGDYEGSITVTFKIAGISLGKCEVEIKQDRVEFTGRKIELPKESIIVRYNNGNKKEDIDSKNFEVVYHNNTEIGEATVTIEPKGEGSILSGNATEKFKIVGKLGKDVHGKDGDEDKIISNTTDTPQTVDYSKDAPKKPSAKISFQEMYLETGLEVGPGNFKTKSEVYSLSEGKDYQIVPSSDTSVIGVHNITIEGVDDGYYSGQYNTTFTVWGNLADITEADYDPIDSVPYTGAPVVPKLNINYGGKRLVYGEDYTFKEDDVDRTKIGPSSVTLVPVKGQSDTYMRGEKTIHFRITASIEGGDLNVTGFQTEYTYQHGEQVVTENDIKVSLDKTGLKLNTDYKVTIENNIDVGTGTITVEGINNYSGTAERTFRIHPYSLTDHDKQLAVKYDSEQTYTGSVIVPTVSAITDVTSHAAIKMDEIEIAEGDKGDRVNYVNYDISPEAQHPTFIVRPKTKNYTGSLSREFTIVQKNLNEEGITVDSINDKPYENGNQIKPMPRVTHGTRPLTAIEYDANKSYADYTRNDGDFVYRFLSDDLRHPGLKEIQITGVGNYTGSVTINFNIIKKDITQEDVTVVFDLEENPVYNGENQIPAFNLMYLGESILRWDGLKLIDQGNQYMSLSTTTVEPGENATNAGNASFIIKTTNNDKSDPYYEGERTVQFTIDKLQIQDYTKFFYRPTGSDAIELRKGGYKLSYEFKEKTTVKPVFASDKESGELAEEQVGVYYNNGVLNIPLFSDGNNANKNNDYTVAYAYVEPDTDDTPIREEYSNPDPELSYAGKVKVTISGQNNYSGSASFWYYIGTDISAEGASSLQKTTTVFNAQQQWPVEVVSGLDASKYRIVRYRHAVTEENILGEKPVKDKEGGDTKAFIDADTYYIRIEGKPEAGTYSSKPIQLTYTILPRSINRVLIDGYKAEYQYTGSAVCPAGLTVTDPIDEIRYKLTENKDYTISYSNNINAGVASIIIKGQGNYDSGTTATARFTITSSTISSGSSGGNGGGNSAGSSDGSSGQLAGPSSAISADDVRLTMDTSDAMYYTGSAVYPGVYISGMTENIDYTVTFSNNINVGQGIVTIRGINNSSGVITKTFRIIGDLAKCSVAAIPDQAYTGLAVTPGVTVTCGTNTLLQGTDYTLSYANNINIGTASVVITAARDSNYVGSVTVNFSIGNGISSAVVSGYASHYTYTGEPITPAVSVAAGSATLRAGTDYTVEYADNTNAGTATMTITGKGVYSGTQKVTFVIEPKSIASCTTTDVSGKKYTGDAYTPAVTVSDGGKTLTNGVDYTVTYANNTNPGVASIIIRALNDNYTGTKTINFRIGTVAVSNFHAGNIKSTSMTLAWTAQDYASGYQICDANSRVVKNSTKNKVTLTGLTSGKTYKYKVRSFIRRADGTRAYGSFSTVISATTKLKTPTVKAASTGKNKARIRWSKVTGATGYQIYYSKSATKGFKKLKTTKNTVRTLNIRGLSSGQRYFFRVRAYKRVGSKNIYSNYNSLKAITVK